MLFIGKLTVTQHVKFSASVCNPKVFYSVYKGQLLSLTLMQLSPVRTLAFCTLSFNIILQSRPTPWPPKWF